MTTIVTRAGKGSPLTNTEMDSNLTNLNIGKLEKVNPSSSGTLTHSGDMLLSGNVLVTNPGGLGYGTGAGGSVVQATSKSTAVTLNKPTGQIAMNAAALAAGASVVFTVNNSIADYTDGVVVNSPDLGLNYRIESPTITVGSFSIRVTNISAGSLSQAVLIQFAIIKGAVA